MIRISQDIYYTMCERYKSASHGLKVHPEKSNCSVPTETPSLCNFIGSLDVINCRLNYIYNYYTDIEQHSQWSHQISYAQWTQICTSYSKGLTSKTRDRISATPIFLTLITVCLEIRNYATQNQQSTIKKNTIMRYRSIEPSHLHLSPWTSKGIKKATAIPPCCSLPWSCHCRSARHLQQIEPTQSELTALKRGRWIELNRIHHLPL